MLVNRRWQLQLLYLLQLFLVYQRSQQPVRHPPSCLVQIPCRFLVMATIFLLLILLEKRIKAGCMISGRIYVGKLWKKLSKPTVLRKDLWKLFKVHQTNSLQHLFLLFPLGINWCAVIVITQAQRDIFFHGTWSHTPKIGHISAQYVSEVLSPWHHYRTI